jgi:hypothetical protein
MRIAFGRAESGLTSLAEHPSHDHAPVDCLHALAVARNSSWLESVGVDLIAWKIGNRSRSYPAIVAALIDHLDSVKSLRLKPGQSQAVAELALREYTFSFCPACGGRGEIEAPIAEDREGAVPMTTCKVCNGSGDKLWTKLDREREHANLTRAFDEAHDLLHSAFILAYRRASRYMKD